MPQVLVGLTRSITLCQRGCVSCTEGTVQVMSCRSIFRQCFFFGKKPEKQLKRFQHGCTIHAAAILSKENKTRCISSLQSMKPIGQQKTGTKKAAVLVPLCMVNKQLSLLYTLRSSDLSSYRGQVSFPGGMFDKQDKTLEQTAVRETCEELGINRQQVDIWGHAGYVSPVTKDISVLPYVAYIGEVNVKKLTVNPKEVESAFTVPLSHLCNLTNFRYTQFRGRYILPVFLGGEYRVWGMTAVITHILLTALLPEQYKSRLVYMTPVKAKERNRQ